MTVRKLSQLQGLPVCAADGRRLGHVHDVRVTRAQGRYRVAALVIGGRGLLVRLGIARTADTVAWDRVTDIAEDRITVSG
jgi:sporulation protein YlmC with PRC-barrel domain